jgi:hypothetical protein
VPQLDDVACAAKVRQPLSGASAAENLRFTCGLDRGAPVFSTQRLPTGTPHVGQGTADSCLRVSAFFIIEAGCDETWLRDCSILDILAGNLDCNQSSEEVAA